jgi:hypothetical protein
MSTPPARPDTPRSKPIWKRLWFWVAVVVILIVVIAAGTNQSSTESASSSPSTAESASSGHSGTAPTTVPATDEQVCSQFREVAGGAFGESLSKSEVAAKVEEIGRLAKDASVPDIQKNALSMAKDPQATAENLIKGDPDAAADALAEECNARYPI